MITLLACFCLLAGAANAAVIYDNLSSHNDGWDGVTDLGPLSDSFSTGPAGFNLADVQLLLFGTASASSISVAVYSNVATIPYPSPGTLLTTIGTLSDYALPVFPLVIDFSLASPYPLAPDTRYWLTVSSTDGSTANWGWSLDQGATGVAGEYYANFNSGSNPNDTGPYQMALSDMSSVPIPGAILLFGPGLAGLAAVRRRLKK
jgi:hypothetical protein